MNIFKRFPVSVFLLIVLLIILFDITFWTGGISFDSGIYLKFAYQLSTLNGFFGADPFAETTNAYVTVWPWGYPLTIALVSLSNLIPVLWASKIVNWLFVVFLLMAIRRYDRLTQGTSLSYSLSRILAIVVIGALILPMPIINLSLTLTDMPFAFSCITAVFYLAAFQKEQTFGNWFLVLIFSFMAFLMKYNGIFINGVLFMPVIYYFLSNRTLSYKYLSIFGANVSLCFLYLGVNYYFTGSFTGISRANSTNDFSTLFLEVLGNLPKSLFHFLNEKSLIVYLLGAITLIGILYIFISAFFSLGSRKFKEHGLLYLLLASNSIIYLVWLFLILLSKQADPMGPRYLYPIVFSALVILVIYLYNTSFLGVKMLPTFSLGYIRFGFALVFGLYLLVSFPSFRFFISHRNNFTEFAHKNSYSVQEEIVKQQLINVPKGAYVALIDTKAMYLRPDLGATFPRFSKLYKEHETLTQFITRVKLMAKGYNGIYFYTRHIGYYTMFEPTIRDSLNKYRSIPYVSIDSLDR